MNCLSAILSMLLLMHPAYHLLGQNQLFKNSFKKASSQKEERFYLDVHWEPIEEAEATYYLIREYKADGDLMTDSLRTGQAILDRAESPAFARYDFKYYYLNDQLAFTVETLVMKADMDLYQYDGKGLWYHENGSLMAKGQFELGNLKGEFIEYHIDGSLKEKSIYLDGNKIKVEDLKKVFGPMVGKWAQFDPVGGKEREALLHYEFREDGLMYIYHQKKSYLSSESAEQMKTELREVYWKYYPKSSKSGNLEMYQLNGRLYGKASISVKEGKQMSATMTDHISHSMIGKTYDFKLVH